jgi:hypothetical protein
LSYVTNCAEKISYATQADAESVGRLRPGTLYTYQCFSCGFWHLTSHRRPRWLRGKAYEVRKAVAAPQRDKPTTDITDFGTKLLGAWMSRSGYAES